MKNYKKILLTILTVSIMLTSCISMPYFPTQEEEALVTSILQRNRVEVEAMLNNGVTPNARAMHGQTALMVALNNSDLEMADLLLSYGADINMVDEVGASALFYVKKPRIQKWLINNGIDLYIVSDDMRTAFEQWCFTNATIITESEKINTMNILYSQGLSITRADMEESFWVSKSDIVQTVSLFVEAGYDVNKTESDVLYTPLIVSAITENYVLISELLKVGADPNMKNKNNDDALNIITRRNFLYHSDAEYSNIVAELITHGADINMRDGEDNTPLCNAALIDHLGRVRILLSMGCLVDAPGQYGESALFKTSNFNIVQNLVYAGADVNFESPYGNTPLFPAINVQIVQYLISSGADVHHINSEGYNILVLNMYEAYRSYILSQDAVGIDNMYIEKVRLLIAAGIDVNYDRGYNDTAMYHASRAPFEGLVAVLVQAGGTR